MARRINMELTKMKTSVKPEELLPAGCTVEKIGDDDFNLKFMLPGPAGSPYEGGTFEIHLALPADYPFKAPKIAFKTPIHHPCVHASGHVCDLSFGTDNTKWAPACKLAGIMQTASDQLADLVKAAQSPVNVEMADAIASDKQNGTDNFGTAARAHTAEHAK